MLLRIFLWFLCLMTIMACQKSHDHSLHDKQIEISESYFKAAFQQDYEVFDKLFTKDFLFIGPSVNDTLNVQELKNSWLTFHQKYDYSEIRNVKIYTSDYAKGDDKPFQSIMHYYDAYFHLREKDIWISFPVHVKFHFKKTKIDRMYIMVNQRDIQFQEEGI